MRIKFHTSAGIEPTPSCLPGERLDHYTTEAGFHRFGCSAGIAMAHPTTHFILCLLSLTLGSVHTIDDSLTSPPPLQGGGSISMKIVQGHQGTPGDGGDGSAEELAPDVHGKLAVARRLATKWEKYKPTLTELEELRHDSRVKIDGTKHNSSVRLTQVDNNSDVELLPSHITHGAGGPVPKLVVSDLMIPKPVKSAGDKILDPAVSVKGLTGASNAGNVLAPGPLITSVNDLMLHGDSSSGPGNSDKKDLPASKETAPAIDPCLVCDCRPSTSLLNCNRRNLHNNSTALLSSPLLSCKYTTVCLSNNNIEVVTQFPRLEQITRLCLSNNPVKSIVDGAFKRLSNLVFLDLSYTKLNAFVLTPNVFQGNYAPDYYEPLRSLRILNLSHNDFHSLNADLFEHLPNLEELHLSHNPLGVIDMPTAIALASVPYLKVLDLSYTGLSALPNHLLHTPRYLHTLNLSYNLFSVVPEQLSQSHELQVLQLNGNPISVIKSFPVLSNLHTLSLSAMPELVSLQANSLSNLPALQEFYAANNSKLSFIHASTFSRTVVSEDGQSRTTVWPPLEKLVLSNNALQRLDGTLVARWDKLKVLDIRYNPWMCDCENQWLVSSLLPLLEANHPHYINNLKCREPVEMANINLLDLDHKNYHMRCLDLYSHRPEYDSVLLIIVLLTALLSVPLCINLVLCARKRRTAPPLCPNVHYSRAFYKPGVRTSSSTSDVISTHYIL
ncbi:hypothetical protein M8J77_024192 [Diaphorina citri]|nr:hypothetical protein M8J77_024192 [Diaphorina citri]